MDFCAPASCAIPLVQVKPVCFWRASLEIGAIILRLEQNQMTLDLVIVYLFAHSLIC
jgi:hypothetical protein